MKTPRKSIKLFISRGAVRAIYDDALLPLRQLGKSSIRRASHVEPSRDGGWDADLSPVGGPVIRKRTRAQALGAERDYLNRRHCQ